MSVEIGSIVEGVVTGIAKFGAFVDIGDKKTGLVHISEVSSAYVTDINEYLQVRDTVKVKVLGVDEKGKIALSIKQAQVVIPEGERKEPPRRDGNGENTRFSVQDKEKNRMGGTRGAHTGGVRTSRRNEVPVSFEDKLSRFLKDSDERLLDLRRNVESKRGGRGTRRSD